MAEREVERELEKDVSVSVARPSRSRDEENGETLHTTRLGKGELEVVHIRESNAVLRKLQAAEAWMDKKLGVESIGAERVPEDQRKPPRVVNVRPLPSSSLALNETHQVHA